MKRVRVTQSFIKSMCLCVVICSVEVLGATLTVPAQYPTIQAAINAADPNDTIIVSPATYVENINFNGKDIILTSTDPGDPGVVESTIIDGNQNGSVVTFAGTETTACTLRGFTITNGYVLDGDGAGIYGNMTHANIEDCIITGNTAESVLLTAGYGGGLCDCDGLIARCIISDNIGRHGGGFSLCSGGSIIDCIISDNNAKYGGGGAHCNSSIINCLIKNNSGWGWGGGLENCGGITNCIIIGNTAGDGGGLRFVDNISHCTIINNVATRYGGGLENCDDTITNCIIWGNSAAVIGDQLHHSSNPNYSCIQDWTGGGIGNITTDPMFVDISSTDLNLWDLHLYPSSPCIDTGTNTPPGGLPAFDIEGNTRPFDGDFDGTADADMGVYESHMDPNEPCLFVTPRSAHFTALQAGTDPNPQLLTILNPGEGTVNWSADLTDKPDWLTVIPTSGTLTHAQSENVTLSVDISGLSGGQYSYSFEVADPAAQNSPQTATVDLEVVGPILDVSQADFTFIAPEDGSDPNNQILTISNSGGGILNWSIADVNSVPFLPPDWLTITPTSGILDPNTSEQITISTDISNLSGGQYSYSFEVSDPAAQNSPQTITVDLEVIGPILEISQTDFSFTTFEGGSNPKTQTLTISNPGGGILNWSIVDVNSITFLAPDWLIITPTSGVLDPNTSEQVTISTDISGLSGGQYSYSFEVSDPTAQNSPQIVNVDLKLGSSLYVPSNYPTIQSAINAALEGDGIIVSPGIYVDNINFNGKNIILTSTNPDDLNVIENTIIDGNQSGSVVTFSGSENPACILRGFTITNGYTVVNGGGIRGNSTNAAIEKCIITGNTAFKSYSGGYGGGLYACNGMISDCEISNNTGVNGGGLYNCDGVISNCLVDGNRGLNYGGGFDGCDGSTSNCMISNNLAHYGGGGLARCAGTISNCVIKNNSCYESGGGFYECGATLFNCIIFKNVAVNGGGLNDCNGTITNCIIFDNEADYGGGLYSNDSQISNSIIWSNSATQSGNQWLGNSLLPIYSCIEDWIPENGGAGNISNDPLFADISSIDPNEWDLNLSAASPCIDAGTNTPPGGLPSTDIEGSPRPFDGDFNGTPIADMGAYEFRPVADEPFLFVTPKIFTYTLENPDDQILTVSNLSGGTLNWLITDINEVTFSPPDWLTVTPISGSLGHAESDNVTLAVDITGLADGHYSYSFEVSDPTAQNTPQFITVNIGSTIHVPGDFPTIQSAIDAADANYGLYTIIVSPGTYVENIDVGGKDIILTSTNPDDPNVVENTIIDGNQNGPVITFSGSETPACTLRGFTITNGGSGIFGNHTVATIANSIITYNYATSVVDPNLLSNNGGGLHQCDGMIINCLITHNTAQYEGGGLYQCNGMITNCQITNNTASYKGGGLYQCNGVISNCTISNNQTTYYECWSEDYMWVCTGGQGGGFYECDGTIIDCIISGNVSYYGGGLDSCNAVINNCTISNSGTGLDDCRGSIENCTVTGNSTALRAYRGSILNCTITNNTYVGLSYGSGAINNSIISNNGSYGLYNYNGDISNCSISHNGDRGLMDCEGPVRNCIIADNAGAGIVGRCEVIENCTIAGNSYGIAQCPYPIKNCIIWGNSGGAVGYSSTPTYSCIQDWTGGGTGNITSDPLFADPVNSDYHLKSEYGRWDPTLDEWIFDTVTSPCIDTGDPTSDWTAELWPHGGRINMGAYGGIPQASMSGYFIGNAVDVDHDKAVTFNDFSLFAQDWQKAEYLLDTDFDLNGVVDINDLMEMSYWWLWVQGPVLEVSETSFSSVGYEGGPSPDSNILTISNTGVESLNWSIDLTGKPDWLIVTPTSGSVEEGQTEDVTLQYDITGLSVGQYSYSFEVSDPAADNSPQVVTVNLHVVADPLAHWKLDGDATDSSFSNYHGTVHGDPNWIVQGIDGGCLELDGVDDYIEAPFILNPADSSLSAFAWVKGGEAVQGIISQFDDNPSDDEEGRYWLHLSSMNTLATQLRPSGGGGLLSDVIWDPSFWHHVGVVWDSQSGVRHLYLDGVEIMADITSIGNVEPCKGALLIGTNKLHTGNCWDGQIDDVRIYARVLSEEEVAALFTSF